MKLLDIKPSNRKDKRLVAIFSDGTSSHFGQANPKDGTFIDHKDKKKRNNYRARHQKDLETNDPTKPGYLSYYILWGDSSNLKTNIRKYKKMFNL